MSHAIHETPGIADAELTSEKESILDLSEQEDEEAAVDVRYRITSYGADYPVDSLVKRLRSGSIEIPSFQRGYVWSWGQASRFVESLLLGLPVPGIFLSRDTETQKLWIIDGQQRLKTLWYFYDGILNRREFRLSGVNQEFQGVSYKTLNREDQLRLDDSIIHATIVRQDDPKEADHSSIYLVFERLNTGGTALSPQEIRTCVYRGEFCDLLLELNKYDQWRELYGPKSKRAKDQEFILRFFALFFDLEKYRRPMKIFLNDFMASNQRLNRFSAKDLRALFEHTVSFALEQLGPSGFRPERNLNAAVTDALLVGTAHRLKQGDIVDAAAYRDAHARLIRSEEFLTSTKYSTTNPENVRTRIRLAIDAFEGVE